MSRASLLLESKNFSVVIKERWTLHQQGLTLVKSDPKKYYCWLLIDELYSMLTKRFKGVESKYSMRDIDFTLNSLIMKTEEICNQRASFPVALNDDDVKQLQEEVVVHANRLLRSALEKRSVEMTTSRRFFSRYQEMQCFSETIPPEPPAVVELEFAECMDMNNDDRKTPSPSRR